MIKLLSVISIFVFPPLNTIFESRVKLNLEILTVSTFSAITNLRLKLSSLHPSILTEPLLILTLVSLVFLTNILLDLAKASLIDANKLVPYV